VQREERHQRFRSLEISNTNTSRERKEDTKVLSLKISFKISDMNKHAQQREKDTKSFGSEDLI
jgi:hypothetical protein